MKARIREDMKRQLTVFSVSSDKEKIDAKILSALTESEIYQRAHKIAAFYPLPFEFDTRALWRDDTKIWLLPKCLPERRLAFLSADGALSESKGGLIEPVSGTPETPDLILVPGLAWNFDNQRIGFGGGYYDRYLAVFKGDTVSLGYDFQRLEFPAQAHDVRVQKVFTNE
ncbi:MAG: 5-formyltetrahydrofolate cyclo-ligase [Streptococcaceae bacterium]|nr:5-formyltetrahydrofolate cyclo-ligase [Streptococcaceae bacterium]